MVGCYISHQDSKFYDKDKPFVDLEDDIMYFKTKGEVIVFADMNARTRNLEHNAQRCFISHALRCKKIY